jgi:Carboxypeptidase regulatory-like domain
MKRTSFCLIGIAVSLLLSETVLAQELATLKVTVNDQTGAVIPGATVVIKNNETGLTRSDVTESHGLSVMAGVLPGNYELTVTAQGFASRTLPLSLSVGQTSSLPVTLGVSVKEEVQVQDIIQGIDTEKSDVSQVIDTPKIADLPISGRDFIDFVLLTPSVNVGRSTAVGAQSPFTETVLKLSFGGVRESHTSFFALDGIDYTTSISGVQRISPSQDWVQEFRVVDSPYATDTGRNLGSVVNTITKSGTNDVHGSAYEFFRNNDLDAKNLLSAPGFNTLRFNQFGGTLGGPIRKEKNFYFLGYEGQRRAESPLYSSFILHCINATGCLGPGTPSINQVKQDLGLQPERLNSFLTIDNFDKSIVKSSNALSDKTFLNVSYLFNDSRKENARGAAPGEGLPSSYRDNPVRDQTVYGNLIHIFSHNLTSETLLQYGNRHFDLIPKGLGLEPALGISDLLSSGGFVGSVRFYREQRFQVADNLSYTRGDHTFKFGGELQPVWTSTQVPLFSPGFGIFSPQSFFGVAPFDGTIRGTGPGTPVAYLFLEPRSLFGQPIPNRDPNFQHGLYAGPSEQLFNDATTVSYRHILWSGFIQDQWKVRSNFSLSFGLRYDVDSLPSGSELKQIGGFHPTNYNNVQPRASFAYAFHGGKGVVRGGFGIFDGPFVYSDILVSWVGASEFSYMTQPFLPEFKNPSQNLIGFGPSGAVGVCDPNLAPGACVQFPGALRADFTDFVSTGAYPAPNALQQVPLGYAQKKFNQPFAEQASLEVEHQIGKDFYFSAGYQWMHASRLPVYTSINGDCPGHVEANCPRLPSGKEFFCNAPTTAACPPASPPGVPTTAGPADPSFGFVLYVKPIGFSLYNAGTLSLRKAFSRHYDFLANYTWSKSIDISTTVNLPNTPENYLHPEFDRAVGDNDIRHRFTLAFLTESPKQWPLVVRDLKFSLISSLQSARWFSINAGFDTNGDGFPFPDRVGTSPRNSYKGDPFYNVDARLQREIPFGERIKGEASVEMFNLLNRPNVLDVDHVYGLADFAGPLPREFGDHISSPANPTFGSPKFAAEGRQLQLSFRLTF